MIIYKSCVRCHGDIHLKEDQHGQYLNCLQCGATADVPTRIDIMAVTEVA